MGGFFVNLNNPVNPPRLFLALFFLSGATTLVYQVLWLRLLTLVFGTTTFATGAVLSAFMIGLALGALLLGSYADRVRRPIGLYALLELGVAVSALALPFVLDQLHLLYPRIYGYSDSRPWTLPLVRLLLSWLVLLVPCMLIGATLPVFVRFAARMPESFGRQFSWLYGMNILGAVAGAVVGGFFLLAELGTSFTNHLAAATNLFLALAFFALDRVMKDSLPPLATQDQLGGSLSTSEKLIVAVAALSGFTVLGLEVLWTRALVQAFFSTAYTFSTILATVLLALAFGSFLAGRWALSASVDTDRRVLGRLAIIEGLFALFLLMAMPLLGQLVWFHGYYDGLMRGMGLPFAKVLTTMLLVFVPATTAGMLFPYAVQFLSRRLSRLGELLGRVYLVNTLAAAAGALVFSFLLIPSLGVARSYLLVVVVHLLVAGGIACYVTRRAAWLVAATVLILASGLTLQAVDRRDLFGDDLLSIPGMGMQLLEVRETADATYAIYERTYSRERLLYVNGFVAAYDGAAADYMPLMAHLPVLLHPEPKQVLVIAFGTGRTAGASIQHPIDALTIVDVSSEVYRLAPYFSPTNYDVLEDPRVTALVEDGRNYVNATHRRFDVITSEPMPPKFSGMVNLYTREYYQAARSRLTSQGVICQWLPFHLMSYDDARIVVQTFLDVFPHASLWIVRRTGLLIGGVAPIEVTTDSFRRAFEDPVVRETLDRMKFHTSQDLVDALALDSEGLRIFAGNAPVMTDDRPYLEFSGDQDKYGPGGVDASSRAIERIRSRRGLE